jgi:hypothetical protein
MSTLSVNNLTTLTGSTITVASGKTLDASQGFTPPAGSVVQVQQKVLSRDARSGTSIIEANSGTGANIVTSTVSWVTTGLTKAITIQDGNKILLQCNINDIVSSTEAQSVGFAFYINGVEVNLITAHAGYYAPTNARVTTAAGVFLSKALAAGTYTVDIRWYVTAGQAYFLNGHTSTNSESTLVIQEVQA